jgi:ATP-dependent DNA ligase
VDLLHLEGRDLRSAPIEDRRDHLAGLLAGADPCLQFSEAVEGDGPAVFAQPDAMNLEGIVSKRKGSTHKSGGSSAWQKTKTYTTALLARWVTTARFTPAQPSST